MQISAPNPSPPKLGIVAGGGDLPARILHACRAEGRDVFVLGLEGMMNHPDLFVAPHALLRLGALGTGLDILRKEQVRELVLAGHVKRPSLKGLAPDIAATRLLGKLGAKFFAGDNALLSALIEFLEEEGFTVIGADDLLADALADEGLLGGAAPSATDRADIQLGMKAAMELGKRDIGQAVIVRNGALLGEEDANGTDALIARCSADKYPQKSGVLVKARKPHQDRRADLPAIGIRTVEAVAAAGLAGIAVEAGGSLILDKDGVKKRADALGVFVIGVKPA